MNGLEPIHKQNDERRLGRFLVSFALLDQWRSLAPLMRDLVIVRAQARYDISAVEYSAFSEHFEIVDDCEMPPEYEAIALNQDGEITVQWKRK